MLLVGDDGKAIGAPCQCDYNLRLPPSNGFIVIDGKAVCYSGEINELDEYNNDHLKLVRIEFDFKDDEGIKEAKS